VPHGVQDLVEEWCRRTPDARAVRDPGTGEELSYAGLWHRSGVRAAALIDAGVRPGDVVAIDLRRSVEMIVAMLGIIRAGAAYLPLAEHAPPARREEILREAGATVVIPKIPAAQGIAYQTMSPGGDDPIYVMYTSGSTGRPKGVVVPHRAVIRLVVEPTYCTINAGDRVAHASNPAFDASTFEIWGPLAAGATVVVFPAITQVGIERWAALLGSEQITATFLTTSLFHTVAQERPGSFGTLDTLVVGGEQLEKTAVEKVLAAGGPGRLVNGYGPTETTTFAASFDCTPESIANRERIPIGFPLQNTELYVLDGELCIGGPGVALGYHNRPELTGERFVTHEQHGLLYRTGDLARRHPDGSYEVLGRRDRQVKLRGFRIELEEIERAAMATGLVGAAFVEKVGAGANAVLIGFALCDTDVGSQLSSRLAETLPGYMVPSRWVSVARLPLGPTGKVDRAGLLALLEDPIEERILTLCRDVLNVDSLSDNDNLLALGGNSITAMRLSTRIGEQLGIQVEPAEILLADSLSELIASLR
jgi:amino acid adenylation domain-containing protein